MSLCFVEPQDAVCVIIDSVGRDARRRLISLVVNAWVDVIPERELDQQYAKAVEQLCDRDIEALTQWHAEALRTMRVIPSRDFLVNTFPSLGDGRRDALRIAASLRGAEAFDAGVSEDDVLDTVLPRLGSAQLAQLAEHAVTLYIADHTGGAN